MALKAAMDDLQVVMEEQHESIVAMILEPIVQAACGFTLPSIYSELEKCVMSTMFS
jgi:adenosylmethionine-8-amino-7-oxononanoate aminotransferase